nr:hypothetical protein CFP56_18663 [Quercus suber]
MDGRGGCCIASYGANGVYDMSKMDMIMLRFRPIAPKPAAGAGSSGGSLPEKADAYVKSGFRWWWWSAGIGNGCFACARARAEIDPGLGSRVTKSGKFSRVFVGFALLGLGL